MTENETQRKRYRPPEIRVLFVGESAPAAGTFFYRADSNLYRATREAFARALGPMPDGEAFLRYFQQAGCWLVDLADLPVNRMQRPARSARVARGVAPLADLIRRTRPGLIVGVKKPLGPHIVAAAKAADADHSRIHVLPFPSYQWRRQFIDGLATILAQVTIASPPEVPQGQSPRRPSGVTSSPDDGHAPRGRMTLHEAMASILAVSGPLAPTALAEAVAARDLYRRADGEHAEGPQISARARQYGQRFLRQDGRIALRR